MPILYRLSIHPSHSLEQAWQALDDVGIEILYGSEEEGQVELFAYLPFLASLTTFNWILACEPYTLPSIDWKTQWAAHAHNQSGELLTSGIRTEERDAYLDQMTHWGWSLQNEQEEMGWIAFYFIN